MEKLKSLINGIDLDKLGSNVKKLAVTAVVTAVGLLFAESQGQLVLPPQVAHVCHLIIGIGTALGITSNGLAKAEAPAEPPPPAPTPTYGENSK